MFWKGVLVRVNPWLEKSKQNLIPLSISNEFSEALKEWSFTGDVEDHGDLSVDCEMCEHPELRYHFEIKNKLKSNILWVGSSCIERFEEIELFDEDGNRLVTEESRRKELKRHLKKKLEDIMLEPIRELWKVYPRDSKPRKNIQRAVHNYKMQSGFSPQEILLIFSGLDRNDISYEAKRYKVSLRSDCNKYFIKTLIKEDIIKLLPCFSKEQLKKNQDILTKIKTDKKINKDTK